MKGRHSKKFYFVAKGDKIIFKMLNLLILRFKGYIVERKAY